MFSIQPFWTPASCRLRGQIARGYAAFAPAEAYLCNFKAFVMAQSHSHELTIHGWWAKKTWRMRNISSFFFCVSSIKWCRKTATRADFHRKKWKKKGKKRIKYKNGTTETLLALNQCRQAKEEQDIRDTAETPELCEKWAKGWRGFERRTTGKCIFTPAT